MQKGLVIAEKPDLLKKIMSAYKKHAVEFDFVLEGEAQVGHLFGLKLPKEMDESMQKWSQDLFPWFPHHWEYKITESKDKKFKTTKTQIYHRIKDALRSGKYDFVVHAGDPDQEGELLIRETLMEAGNSLPVKRLWVNASTNEDDYVKGLKSLKPDSEPFYENMYQAALARQHSDYLIGMNFSPIVSLRSNEVSNIGRLKTFIISIICQREDEVLNWKPSSSYGIRAKYQEGFSGDYVEFFPTKEKAEGMLSSMSNSALVTLCETKRVRQYAPSLFKLSTLQIEASKKGFKAEEVQDIAQSLYEKGYMSYPRTSCEYVSSSAEFERMLESAAVFPDLKSFIDRLSPEEITAIRSKRQYVRDKETAESGHQALTPTTKLPNLEALSGPEKEILHMVFAEYVAAFLPPMVQDKTRIETENNGYQFVTTGKTLIEKGYTELLKTEIEDVILPKVEKGQTVSVDGFEIIEKKATRPKRYTDGTLVQALEHPAKYLEDSRLREVGKTIDISIGQPSTRAETIKQLVRLGYLEFSSGKVSYLIPTDKGKRNYKNMQGSDLCKADTTAIWEEKLEDIRTGKMTREQFEKEIRSFVVTNVDELKRKPMESAAKEGAEVIGKCPKCGADFVSGKFGPYCSGKCGFTFGKFRGKDLTTAQKKKLLQGKPIEVKGLKSKAGKDYGMKVIPTKQFTSTTYNGKTMYFMEYDTEFLKTKK